MVGTSESFKIDAESVEKLIIAAMTVTAGGYMENIPLDWIFSKDFLQQLPEDLVIKADLAIKRASDISAAHKGMV